MGTVMLCTIFGIIGLVGGLIVGCAIGSHIERKHRAKYYSNRFTQKHKRII
jgi:uncharacterized protein YneF (UPF0154 family)